MLHNAQNIKLSFYVTVISCDLGVTGNVLWQSTRLVIKKSWVQVPAGAAGEFSSPGSTFCADS